MPTVAIISQKGGAGKTTLALHLATAAQDAGMVSLIVDTDPQATASQWASWRKDEPPEVIDSPPPRLAAKIEQAKEQGAQFIVIDTPPHADSAARAAVEAADLVLIPCRPSAFDLAAIQTTVKLVQLLRKPAFVVFTAGSQLWNLSMSCAAPRPGRLSPCQRRRPNGHGDRAERESGE